MFWILIRFMRIRIREANVLRIQAGLIMIQAPPNQHMVTLQSLLRTGLIFFSAIVYRMVSLGLINEKKTIFSPKITTSIQIRIRILETESNPEGQLNADPCGSGSKTMPEFHSDLAYSLDNVELGAHSKTTFSHQLCSCREA